MASAGGPKGPRRPMPTRTAEAKPNLPVPSRHPRPSRPAERPSLGPPVAMPQDGDSERQSWGPLMGEGVVGRPGLSPSSLSDLAEAAVTRHFFYRMARPGPDRSAEVDHLCELLGGLSPDRARRVLRQLLAAERLVDIYPLEIVEGLLDAESAVTHGWRREGFVQNRKFVESRIFGLEDEIDLLVPVRARVRAFALVGGAQPGYHLFPGPPGHYVIELGAPGRFRILLGARIGDMDILDSVHLWVE